MKTRGKMKSASKERARQLAAYRKRLPDWFRDNPHCKACESLRWHRGGTSKWLIKRTTECHHIRGRNGWLLLDEKYWLPVCRSCHEWITLHGKEARQLGFSADVDYRTSER
jgi:hypothetical protein